MSSPRDALTGSGALRSISTSIAPAMRAGGFTRARRTLGYYRQIAPELFAMSVGRSRPYEPAASFVLVNVEIGLARIPDARAGRFRRLSGVVGPGLSRTELVRYRNEELASARVRDAGVIDAGRVDARIYEPLAEDLPDNYYTDVWLPVGVAGVGRLAAILPRLLLAAFERVERACIEGTRLLLEGE